MLIHFKTFRVRLLTFKDCKICFEEYLSTSVHFFDLLKKTFDLVKNVKNLI